ncbi:MAG: hypothetical protein RI554_07865, partial [Trueperaceae bacterium]|nr:hypothetical protein [Trueperaceae bacterium]
LPIRRNPVAVPLAIALLTVVALVPYAAAQDAPAIPPAAEPELVALGAYVFERDPVPCPEPPEANEPVVCFGTPDAPLDEVRDAFGARLQTLDPTWGPWSDGEPEGLAALLTDQSIYFLWVIDEGMAIATAVVEEASPTDATGDAAATAGASGADAAPEASAPPAEAPDRDVEALRACLHRHVHMETRLVPESYGDGYDVAFDVTNDLPWALAGLRAAYEVQSTDRSVPWTDANPSLSIAGGIEPGETRTVTTSAFLPDAALDDDLVVTGALLDVADPDLRLLVADTMVAGWGETPTERPCEGR